MALYPFHLETDPETDNPKDYDITFLHVRSTKARRGTKTCYCTSRFDYVLFYGCESHQKGSPKVIHLPT